MKKNILALGLLSLFLMMSCSSDDDSNNQNNDDPTPEPVVKNYFPSAEGNTWSYENKTTSNANEQTANEVVNVQENNTEGDTEFFSLNSTLDNPLAPSVTNVLSNGELFKTDQILFLNGDIDLGFDAGLGDFALDLSQVVIFDANANPNQLLFSDSNSFSQDFNGINLSVDYEIISESGEQFDTLEVNGIVYEDVISARLAVNLEVTAGQSIFTVAIIEDQEVINATHYFANEVGLIKSEVEVNIEFEDLSDLPVEIPEIPNTNTLVEQGLIDFDVEL